MTVGRSELLNSKVILNYLLLISLKFLNIHESRGTSIKPPRTQHSASGVISFQKDFVLSIHTSNLETQNSNGITLSTQVVQV